jgi:LuxR family maltose regulon positive regulatory protein
MARLLLVVAAAGVLPAYVARLRAAWAAAPQETAGVLVEPLSRREVEVLQLIAQGLSNEQIAARLVLALTTVKGHNRHIFGKLQVQRRTEAVARARELGLV